MTTDGYSTQVFYGDEAPASTQLKKVRELTPPALEVDESETSHFTSANKTKTFRAIRIITVRACSLIPLP